MDVKLTKQCAVCAIISTQWCANCKKVTYCCADHQKRDRKKHKKDCFPSEIKTNQIMGRYQVATRNIQQGEKIFSEKPLMTGPNPSVPLTEMPLCLGCYKHVETSYLCSTCKWPMCDSNCEKLPQHANYECQIFSKRKIPPLKNPVEYYFIQVLRCILLEEKDREKWDIIMGLEHHGQLRLGNMNIKSLTLLTKMFTCFEPVLKLNAETKIVIAQILGVFEINAHGFTDEAKYAGFYRSAMILMHKLSLISHECTPNCGWLRKNEINPPGTFSIELTALVPIKKGEPITIRYSTDMETTIERRSYLKEGYFFDCYCKRCSDPTELGTYYSGVKCPSGGCPNGYLLPIAADVVLMKCDKCGLKNTEVRNFGQREQNSYYEYNMIDSLSPSLKNLKKLTAFIAHQERKLLHPNHHLLFEAKLEVVKMMGKIPNLTLESLEKQIYLCSKLLEVYNKISPGLNNQRGALLYRLFQAKSRLLKIISSAEDRREGELLRVTQNEFKLVQELIEIGKDAYESLTWVPEGNYLLKKAAKLQVRLKSLREEYGLLLPEDSQQNISETKSSKKSDHTLESGKDELDEMFNITISNKGSGALIVSKASTPILPESPNIVYPEASVFTEGLSTSASKTLNTILPLPKDSNTILKKIASNTLVKEFSNTVIKKDSDSDIILRRAKKALLAEALSTMQGQSSNILMESKVIKNSKQNGSEKGISKVTDFSDLPEKCTDHQSIGIGNEQKDSNNCKLEKKHDYGTDLPDPKFVETVTTYKLAFAPEPEHQTNYFKTIGKKYNERLNKNKKLYVFAMFILAFGFIMYRFY